MRTELRYAAADAKPCGICGLRVCDDLRGGLAQAYFNKKRLAFGKR
jgi:hypothetical protein